MKKIKIEVQEKDEMKLITRLEQIQWAVASGDTEGPGWKVETEPDHEG